MIDTCFHAQDAVTTRWHRLNQEGGRTRKRAAQDKGSFHFYPVQDLRLCRELCDVFVLVSSWWLSLVETFSGLCCGTVAFFKLEDVTRVDYESHFSTNQGQNCTRNCMWFLRRQTNFLMIFLAMKVRHDLVWFVCSVFTCVAEPFPIRGEQACSCPRSSLALGWLLVPSWNFFAWITTDRKPKWFILSIFFSRCTYRSRCSVAQRKNGRGR